MADSGYTQQDPDDSASDFRARQFQITRTLSRVRTVVLCQVKGITGGAGAIAPPGTVSVLPLVKVTDGQGNVSSHGTIMNVPVFRVGGGNGAIICDPVVGDIGWLAVADRDSSAAIANNGEAQPGSRRKFNLADSIYLGKLLGDAPEQYVTFTADGMKLHDKNDNNITTDSAGININGILINRMGQVAGNLPVTGALELGGSIEDIAGGLYPGNIHTSGTITGDTDVIGAGKSLETHVHETLGGTGTNTSPPV